ncbi:MAG TPA: hypothetical protein VG272_05055, partial [Candidatus Acidoferrales bacterium]|nr:hypothetical protein [Candidatus Acidoferrales bacterium]
FRINLKQCVWVAAMGLAFGISGGATRLVATPTPQEHHDEDYSKNKNYQTGMRDGRDDQSRNRDHYKKRHFKKDDDRNAYESGYQAGHGEKHDDHEEHRDQKY